MESFRKVSMGSLTELIYQENSARNMMNFTGEYSALGDLCVKKESDKDKICSVIQQQKLPEEQELLTIRQKQEGSSSFVNFKDDELYSIDKSCEHISEKSPKKNNIFSKIWGNRWVKIAAITIGVVASGAALAYGVISLALSNNSQNLNGASALNTTNNTTLATDTNNELTYADNTKLNESFLSTLAIDRATTEMLNNMETTGKSSTVKPNVDFVDYNANALDTYIDRTNFINKELIKSIKHLKNIVKDTTPPIYEKWLKHLSGDKSQTILKYFKSTIVSSFDFIKHRDNVAYKTFREKILQYNDTNTNGTINLSSDFKYFINDFDNAIENLELSQSKLVDETTNFFMVCLSLELTENPKFDKEIHTIVRANPLALDRESIYDSYFRYDTFFAPLASAISSTYQAYDMFIEIQKTNKLILKAKYQLSYAKNYILLCNQGKLSYDKIHLNKVINLANELEYLINEAEDDNQNYFDYVSQYNKKSHISNFSSVKKKPTNFSKLIDNNIYEISFERRDMNYDKTKKEIKTFIENKNPAFKSFNLAEDDSYKQAKNLSKKTKTDNIKLTRLIKEIDEAI